jgi:hypothetical protein
MHSLSLAAVYLVGNAPSHLIDLRHSLALVIRNVFLPSRIEPDIFIFVDNESTKEKVMSLLGELLENLFGLMPRVVLIDLPQAASRPLRDIPFTFSNPADPNKPFSLGYRDMCSFFHYELFRMSILDQYDYVLRLDTDSFFLSAFEDSKSLISALSMQPSYCYLSGTVQDEHPMVAVGFRDAIAAYVSDQQIDPLPKAIVELLAGKNPLIYYTNFEIVRLSWIRSPEYTTYAEYIKSTCGIYTQRWGDALLRYYGVALAADANQIIALDGVLYKHSGFYDSRSSRTLRKVGGYYRHFFPTSCDRVPWNSTITDKLFLRL